MARPSTHWIAGSNRESRRHRPTGEEWRLAYCDGKFVSWCGWPEGTAQMSDCDLIRVCREQLMMLNGAFLGMHI
jgi:hypothetical protein